MIIINELLSLEKYHLSQRVRSNPLFNLITNPMNDKTIIQRKRSAQTFSASVQKERSAQALLPETKSQQKFLKDFFKSFLKLILFFYLYINDGKSLLQYQ